MRKIVLLLGFLLLTSSVAYSQECKYTCVLPYDMNNKFSTFISKITGLNYRKTEISESVIKKSASKIVQGDKNLKVNIGSYSSGDLSKGIFKSMTISGNNVNIDGIHLSYFELKSLCEFNYVKYDKKGNLNFKEDFPMSYAVKMSADDINKTMKSEKYQKVIEKVNKRSFAGIKVSSTEADIRSNKFYYIIYVSLPLIKNPKKLEVTADLNVENGKIDFKNTRLASNSFNIDLNKVDFLMDYLNPLDFSVNIFDNKDAKVYIENISIKNNVINTDGVIIIPKD